MTNAPKLRPAKQRLFGDLTLTPEDIARTGPRRPVFKAQRSPSWSESMDGVKTPQGLKEGKRGRARFVRTEP